MKKVLMKKVLITGMNGRIGGLLRRHLEALGGYELSALNRGYIEGIECYQADISDLEAMRPAFDGKDVVVHLAAYAVGEEWPRHLSTNLVGVYNVYEAARQAGVERVVYGGSGGTIRAFERVPPYDAISQGRYDEVPESWPIITHEMVRPEGLEGASKLWGEALGRHFSDAYDISVLCVRIGTVPANDRPPLIRDRAIYLSHRDVVQILHRCIDAPADLKYDIFLATSRNRWGYRDLEHARQVLGYVPQDSADAYE